MSRVSNIPSWWLELTGVASPGALLGLLDQVERAGISRNDKTGVTRIWRERQIVRALQSLGDGQKTC